MRGHVSDAAEWTREYNQTADRNEGPKQQGSLPGVRSDGKRFAFGNKIRYTLGYPQGLHYVLAIQGTQVHPFGRAYPLRFKTVKYASE